MAIRTCRRVAYIPTWQAKNGNYFKNVLLDRRLNLIAKRRRTSPCFLRTLFFASRNLSLSLSFASQFSSLRDLIVSISLIKSEYQLY